MVRAYLPQSATGNLDTNTNNPPQGGVFGGISPVFIDMLFESGETMLYEDNKIMSYEGEVGIPVNWFDTDFKRRMTITILPSQVSGTHDDFPFLFNQILDELKTHIRSDANDIRFVNIDGDVIFPVEIQFIDEPNGNLISWAKIPSISDGFTFYIYFDEPNALPFPTPKDVWSNHLSVYHAQDSVPAIGPVKDSAENTVWVSGGTLTNAVPGQIGNAWDFELPQGNNNFFTSSQNTPNGWWSFWIFLRTSGIQFLINGSGWRFIVGFQLNLYNLFNYPTGTAADSQFPRILNTWEKIDITSTGNGGTAKIYKNGILLHTLSETQVRALGNVDIGDQLNGLIDELRFTSTIPADNDNRVSATYNNEFAPTAFYSVTNLEIIL